MSYTAMYRKWRPDSFDDVRGQEHIVTTLKNQIKADRVGHAYLFCGSRGTGKTTIAKIFAKAVNCENPVDGSPCGKCDMCREISENRSMNVIEIDAASNNGIDYIRQLKDEVAHPPIHGRYLVYIIDEVHALSKDAFNALLKTLEEPPSYVIFILATTEIQSVLTTIISRCQRFDFKRISTETITERLIELTKAEGVEAEEKALKYIAKSANGGMRDAISMLDMSISYYYGKPLTLDNVLDVLGAVDIDVFSDLLRYILFGNIKEAFKVIEDVVYEGRDLTQFTIDFTWYLRNLMLVKTSDANIEDLLDVSSENLSRLKDESNIAELDVIMRYIRIFSGLSNDIRVASNKRILIETAIVKLCRPEMENDNASLTDRIRKLEEKLENGNFEMPRNVSPAENTSVKPDIQNTEKTEKQKLPEALSDDIKKIPKAWYKVISRLDDALVRTAAQDARFTAFEEDKAVAIVPNELAVKALNKDDVLKRINELLSEEIGANVKIEIKANNTGKRFDDVYSDLNEISDILNGFPVEIEE